MTPEGEVKSVVMKALDQLGILYWRMNAGSNTKRIKGQKPGTGDILAAPIAPLGGLIATYRVPRFLWIELKSPTGKTTKERERLQAEFREKVTTQGHEYLLAKSLDDVLAKLRAMGCK